MVLLRITWPVQGRHAASNPRHHHLPTPCKTPPVYDRFFPNCLSAAQGPVHASCLLKLAVPRSLAQAWRVDHAPDLAVLLRPVLSQQAQVTGCN